jgi:hypothetical protein
VQSSSTSRPIFDDGEFINLRSQAVETAHISKDGDFALLGLTGRVAFRSESSISLDIGWLSNSLTLPFGTNSEENVVFTDDKPFVFHVIGGIDVHHPCDGHIKTQIRMRIPAEYHYVDRMKALLKSVFELLAIPPDETYEAVFFSTDKIISIEQATDRHGMTDRV